MPPLPCLPFPPFSLPSPPLPSQALCKEELQRGIMGVDPSLPSTITAFPPGYIDKDKEVGAGCCSCWVLGAAGVLQRCTKQIAVVECCRGAG